MHITIFADNFEPKSRNEEEARDGNGHGQQE